MKIRAIANGNILDLPDDEAEAYLATGIYEPVEGREKKKAKPAETSTKSTKVEPLTTKDVPQKPKKVK